MGETRRVREIYDRDAPRYDRSIAAAEKLMFGGGRQWVCSRATGDVLELATGTGRNLPFYSEDIRLTGIELSPEMLRIARHRAAELGVAADLRAGDAEDLDFPGESFDTIVSTLSMCTIPDAAAAAREAYRVLRPGGRFLLLEHVKSPVTPVRLLQRVLEPVSVRFQADHLLREPRQLLRSAGFAVEHFESWKLGLVERISALKPG